MLYTSDERTSIVGTRASRKKASFCAQNCGENPNIPILSRNKVRFNFYQHFFNIPAGVVYGLFQCTKDTVFGHWLVC